MNTDTHLIFEQYKLINEVLYSKANIERFKKTYPDADFSTNRVFELFNRVKHRIPNKDIFSYKSFEELIDSIIDTETSLSKRERKRLTRAEQSDRIFENDKFTVIVPKTHAASILYGANTKWCISARDPKAFEAHVHPNNVHTFFFFLPKKSNKKMAITSYNTLTLSRGLLSTPLVTPLLDAHDVMDVEIDPAKVFHVSGVPPSIIGEYVDAHPGRSTGIDIHFVCRIFGVAAGLSTSSPKLEKFIITYLNRYNDAPKKYDVWEMFDFSGNYYDPVAKYVNKFKKAGWPQLEQVLLDKRHWQFGTLKAAGNYAASLGKKWPAYERIVKQMIKRGEGKQVLDSYTQYRSTVYGKNNTIIKRPDPLESLLS